MIKRIGDIVLIQLSDIDSNIYLVGDTVIDCGTGFNFTRLRDIFNALKRNMNDVKQIINTHCHFDHVGGNGYFLNAKVAIHEDDAKVLEKGDGELSNADFFDGKLHPRKPERILKEGDKLNPDKLDLEVIHTPGHSPGSICLYDKKRKILFTGDTLFSDGVGRTDIAGGDPKGLESSLQRLLKINV
ncbi:MAG: MBL fold metallo-hydrolase [Candidatus Aenigmatarchaeota archaeon]|nr:MAG: MBL fold metallo-hydrolase [Candidatus Aenigmarchaeota archaeon]